MKRLLFIVVVALATPALATGWEVYANARYGATAEVPPGFEPMGPEAANSDGLIFRSRQGSSVLTIFGADVPGGNFDAFIDSLIAHDQSYNGWQVGSKTIKDGWAEYAGALGARQLRMRVLSSCGGKQAVAVKFEYNGNMNSTVNRVFKSLKAGPAASC